MTAQMLWASFSFGLLHKCINNKIIAISWRNATPLTHSLSFWTLSHIIHLASVNSNALKKWPQFPQNCSEHTHLSPPPPTTTQQKKLFSFLHVHYFHHHHQQQSGHSQQQKQQPIWTLFLFQCAKHFKPTPLSSCPAPAALSPARQDASEWPPACADPPAPAAPGTRGGLVASAPQASHWSCRSCQRPRSQAHGVGWALAWTAAVGKIQGSNSRYYKPWKNQTVIVITNCERNELLHKYA